jgi:opacity protein-like surface antigen
MGRFKTFAIAGAAVLASSAAFAADLPPPFMPQYQAPAPVFSGGWYLRGDIGMTNQRVKSIYNVLFDNDPGLRVVDKNFESGILVGAGVGYKWNNWTRFDITGEYRGETGFHGLDIWGGGAGFNNYTAKKSEWLVLANVYFDLGTWWCITPFIGAGVGWSQVTIHSFRDVGPNNALAFGEAASKSNFAWALHAGLGYDVTHNFTVELAYRFTYLGDGRSGDLVTFDGTNNVNNPMHFKTITSHDVKFGMRWLLQPEVPQPVFAPPIMRKG